MSYGYLGDTSTKIKQVKKNDGIITASDVLDLQSKGHLGGSLELIQSQTVSSDVAQVDFTSIKESGYGVHLLTLNNFSTASGTNRLNLRLSNDGGSSFEAGTNYEYGIQQVGYSVAEQKSTGTDRFDYLANKDGTNVYDAYIYLYNLGNSSKYSMISHHSPAGIDGSYIFGYFGSGVYDTAETINALRVFNSAGANFTQGTAKLYGVKQI